MADCLMLIQALHEISANACFLLYLFIIIFVQKTHL